MKRSDAERVLRKLVLDQYLQEDMIVNHMGLPVIYIYPGKRAKDLLAGKSKVKFLYMHLRKMHIFIQSNNFVYVVFLKICKIYIHLILKSENKFL